MKDSQTAHVFLRTYSVCLFSKAAAAVIFAQSLLIYIRSYIIILLTRIIYLNVFNVLMAVGIVQSDNGQGGRSLWYNEGTVMIMNETVS